MQYLASRGVRKSLCEACSAIAADDTAFETPLAWTDRGLWLKRDMTFYPQG